MPAPQPFTFQYGPWVPDLANVAVQMQAQFGATPVPTADCLNVYYADGTYRSLQSAQAVSGVAALPAQPLGAITGIDPSGLPVPVVGIATDLYALLPGGTSFTKVTSGGFSALQWQFAQYGGSIYALDGSAAAGAQDAMVIYELDNGVPAFGGQIYAGQIEFLGSVTSNVLNVSQMVSGYPQNQLQVGMVIYSPEVTLGTYIQSLGTGTGGVGTYNLSVTPNVVGAAAMYANIPPIGNVLATVGQFLTVGDIGLNFQNSPYVFGTGNGATRTFTGTIPNIPLRAFSIFVTEIGTLPRMGHHRQRPGAADPERACDERHHQLCDRRDIDHLRRRTAQCLDNRSGLYPSLPRALLVECDRAAAILARALDQHRACLPIELRGLGERFRADHGDCGISAVRAHFPALGHHAGDLSRRQRRLRLRYL